jgi:periplasmic copper chaperone A
MFSSPFGSRCCWRSTIMSLVVTSLAVAATGGQATAHATFETPQATANSAYKGILRVPHGCEGEATQSVRITIPEGVIGVKPMPKAGWTLKTTTAAYAASYDYFGKTVTSGVSVIEWSGGMLEDGHFDEFVFQARVTGAFAPGTAMAFPTVQVCKTKSVAWVQVAAAGADAHALKFPAPTVLIQAQSGAPVPAPVTYKVGDLVITTPWATRPPTGARVAGGYLRVTNSGTTSDRLVGGKAAFAKRVEVHEMAMVSGVMRMRELDAGIEIKPGETVELKPGGYHLMFMDMTAPLVPGQPAKLTLQFATAGAVDVDLAVMPPAAGKANSGHSHH